MVLKQADQNRYGRLLKEFRKSYANKQRDLYPEDLSSMFDVMRTVEVKNTKPKKYPTKKKDEEEVQPGAESFSQTGKSDNKDQRCYCCGKVGEYVNDCKIRKEIAEKDWYKNTGIEHYKTHAVSNNTQVAAVSTDQVGFLMMQVASKESYIIIDSGSTISLFKDFGYLTNLEISAQRLVTEANSGSKFIEKMHLTWV